MDDMAYVGLGVDSRPVREATGDLDKFAKSGDRAGESAGKAQGAFAGMSAKMGAAAAAAASLVATFAVSVRTISEFETSISKLGAISGATTSQLEGMRDVAKQLGATTEFSAGQAADGLTFLAQAGFSAAESMAAIPAVLDLATASGLGLAAAADTASNIMSGFGIAAAEAARVSDVLAAAASSSNTNVSQLGGAMSTVAPIAAALGINLEGTAASIGILSDAGIQGERAGTALRGVLAALSGPTSEATRVLNGLGIAISDVDPATNSLSDVLVRLQGAGLSTADAMTIFGREAASGALVLVKGADQLRTFTDELGNAEGAAADMADTMRDNLGGDIATMQSTLSGLILALGEAGLTAVIRGVLQAITGLTRGLTALVDGFSRAKELALAFFGISQEANNLESAMDATELAIDNSTIAMGDQITQSALLATRISSGNVMTVESARVNLESARARLEDVAAMQSQNEAMARQELGADSVLIDIANAQSALTAARNRLTGEEIQYMDEFGEAFNTNQVSLVRDLESGLIDLLSQQKNINAALSEMDFLSDEQVAAQEQSQANIKSIEAALVDAENGMISFNGEVVSGVSLSDRLAASAGDINFSSAVAGAQALAERLSISLHAAMQMMGLLGAASQAAQPVIFDPRDPRFDAAAAESAARSERLTKIMADLADESSRVEINITGASSALDGISSGGGASGAINKTADAMRDQISALEDAANPLRAYNRGMKELDELKLQGLSDGAYALAVEELADQLRDAQGATDQFTQTFMDGMGRAIDYTVGGFSDGFSGLLDIIKSTLLQAVQFAIANPIKLALGIGGVGAGVAGAVGSGGILGGLTGAAGAFGSGLSVVGNGLMAGGLGGAAQAGMGAISGGLSMGGISGFATAAGAALPFVAAAAAVFSFFKSKTKTIDEGISATIDMENAMFESFKEIEKRRFWGLSKRRSASFTELDDDQSAPFNAAVFGIRETAIGSAEALGFTAGIFDGFSHQFKVSLKGLDDAARNAAVLDALEGLGDAMADQVDGLGSLRMAGENSYSTLTRLSGALVGVNGIFEDLGRELFDVSLVGADMASSLVDLFGGMDAMRAATGQFFSGFYSEQERFDAAMRNITSAFGELNIAVPKSRDEFRSLVDGLDTTTQAGRETFAALVSMSGALNEVLPAIGSFTIAIANMVGSLTGQIDAIIGDASTAMQANAQAADLWYRTAGTLREFIADLRGTAGALISGSRARAFSEARFQTLLASAIGGDNQAAGDLTAAARTLLDNTRATVRTSLEMARAEARVLNDIQLVSGVSDIEGARHDVVADLLGQQVDLLGTVRDAINSGNPLTAGDLAGLNGQLGALESAIKAAEMINFAFLSERLNVVVDLVASADIPESLRTLLDNAATGITANIDYIVRADGLTPDLRWLALTSASQHITTVDYLARDNLGPVFTRLALERVSALQKTVNFTIGATLPDDVKRLALAGSSELSRTVNVSIASGVTADAMRVVLMDVGARTGVIRDVMLAVQYASFVSPAQKALLDQIGGAVGGKITLGGSFQFDPSSGFQTWYAGATQANITAPMAGLRSSLDGLAALMRDEAARADKNTRIGELDSFASKLVSAGNGQFIATDAQIRQAAGIAGVDATGSAAQVAARVSAVSGNDAISKLGVYNQDMANLLISKISTPGLQVNPDEYRKAFPMLSESIEPDPQRHFERFTQANGGAAARFNPRLFEWDSIGLDIPAFANGGTHRGGLARVGENDMELVAPSRIYNPSETRKMMSNDNSDIVRELRETRSEMRQLMIGIEKNTYDISRIEKRREREERSA